MARRVRRRLGNRARPRFPRSTPRAVLVTGCSSGIGRAIALRLARRRDYVVFATTRRTTDARELRELRLAGLVPIPGVDLGNPDGVQRAVEGVRRGLRSRGLRGLFAIVSNAGAGSIAPLELLDMDVLEAELRTRVVGPATLVQSLVKEIRTGRGRLIWITTPGPVPLAFKASVHVPEFAVHGLARTWRIELARWAVPSVLVECGGVRSRAVGRMDKELATKIRTLSDEQQALYGEALAGVLERDAQIRRTGVPATEVARVVERVLRSPAPELEVKVGVSRRLDALASLPAARMDRRFIAMLRPGRPEDDRGRGRPPSDPEAAPRRRAGERSSLGRS